MASVSRSIDHGNWVFALSTYASENGWRAIPETTNTANRKQSTEGRWTEYEKLDDITMSELKAGLFGRRRLGCLQKRLTRLR